MCFQETVENVKKCRNFLSTLIKLASSGKQSSETTANVKELVKNLLVISLLLFLSFFHYLFLPFISLTIFLLKSGLCVVIFCSHQSCHSFSLLTEFIFSCTDPLSLFIVQQEGKIEPEDFTSSLYRELNSSPQPYLVPFLNVRSVTHQQIFRFTG